MLDFADGPSSVDWRLESSVSMAFSPFHTISRSAFFAAIPHKLSSAIRTRGPSGRISLSSDLIRQSEALYGTISDQACQRVGHRACFPLSISPGASYPTECLRSRGCIINHPAILRSRRARSSTLRLRRSVHTSVSHTPTPTDLPAPHTRAIPPCATYPHLPQIEIRQEVRLSLTLEDVIGSSPLPFQNQLREIFTEISNPIHPESYALARARDLQSLRILRSEVRVLEESTDGYDQRHFTLPGVHEDHRLQLCDGSITAAKLVIMLHWSSPHDDNLILSSRPFTTTLLRQFGLLPPEESGSTQLAALNLFSVQSSPHWSAGNVVCPEVDGETKPYPAACLAHFKEDRVRMILESIQAGRKQVFALFGTSWNGLLVDQVMSGLDHSYTRIGFKVIMPILLDWEMGIEGVGLSMIKQSLLGRNQVAADEHIIRGSQSYTGIEERLAHNASDRPTNSIDFDLIVQNGDIRGVFLRLPHPSCCGYINSNGSPYASQTLDIACLFLRNLLDGSLLPLPSLPSHPPVFPHSTVKATVQLDTKLLGTKALQPNSSTYKVNLIHRLRAEYHRHLDSSGHRIPFDLRTLPQCLRDDILSRGLHLILASGALAGSTPEDTSRRILEGLLTMYQALPQNLKHSLAIPAVATKPLAEKFFTYPKRTPPISSSIQTKQASTLQKPALASRAVASLSRLSSTKINPPLSLPSTLHLARRA